MKNATIYANESLLKLVYTKYPKYLINWNECDTNAIFGDKQRFIDANKSENLKNFRTKLKGKVITFSNCDQIKELFDFINLDLSAVFKIFINDNSVDQNEIMILAAAKGYANIVTILLTDKRFVFTSAVFDIALLFSCSYGQTKVVKVFMADARINPAVWNNAPLKEARRNHHLDIVNLLLLDPRIDPTSV